MKYFASALAVVGMGALSLGVSSAAFAAPPPPPGTASLPVYKAPSPRVMSIKRPTIDAAIVGESNRSNDNNGQADSGASQGVRHEPSNSASLSQAEISKIQRALRKQGYYLQVNGVWDEATVANVKSLQYKHGLKVTGRPDQATLKLLGLSDDSGISAAAGKAKSHGSKVAAKAELTPEQIKRLQQKLNSHGYRVNQTGQWDNQVRSAIIRLQKRRGLKQTGYPDRPTRRALSITDAMWESWGNHPS